MIFNSLNQPTLPSILKNSDRIETVEKSFWVKFDSGKTVKSLHNGLMKLFNQLILNYLPFLPFLNHSGSGNFLVNFSGHFFTLCF
jgi:hypothetical protein